MAAPSSHEITALLQAWGLGDDEALPKLVPLVYAQLHRAARRHMAGERPSHTLQPTALVHEVYLRLAETEHLDIHDRAHFLAVCARLMRHVLTDFARSRRAQKRGGGAGHLEIESALVASPSPDPDLVAVDEALDRLALVDPRKAKVVELRFFGGLDAAETAQALGVSPQTVARDWKLAKAWLSREMSRAPTHGR
jgi:RNA polymerase sigma-70 factor, ECF subfamily